MDAENRRLAQRLLVAHRSRFRVSHPGQSVPETLLTMSEFLTAALHGRLPLSETFLYAGIVMLIFTPVMRVGAAVVTFMAEHDWKFVGVSAVVLAVLFIEVIISLS